MDLKTFWIGWKRDILRFFAICLGALVLGIGVNRTVARARAAAGGLPRQLEGLVGAMDGDFLSGPRSTAETWTHREHLGRGTTVWIRNLNGAVTVIPAASDSLEVAAVKTFHSSDPAAVKIVRVPVPNGVVLCAVWNGSGSECGPEYNQKLLVHDDVAVAFTLHVPRGTAVDASTVNGSVHITGAAAPVSAASVNGRVDVDATGTGSVAASTVDGSVHVRVRGSGAQSDTGQILLRAVNGALTLELPSRMDATVEARTLNGAIESDYPLEESHRFVGHHLQGTIGRGGRRIELNSINGAIRLKQLGSGRSASEPIPPVAPLAPTPPKPPTPPSPP